MPHDWHALRRDDRVGTPRRNEDRRCLNLTDSGGGVSPLPVRSESSRLGASPQSQFLVRGREAPMDRRYVGIDLHRRRSVLYAMDAEGNKLFCERIENDSLRLLEVVSAAGDGAEVVIEATYGWYWAVDLLRDAGFSVHLGC